MLTVPRKLLLVVCRKELRSFSVVATQSNEPPPAGPVGELARRIEKGDLEADAHQTLVTEALQNIYNNIQGYHPSASESKGFFGLFSGQQRSSNAPKGLYVHGSVGGGKTTLMDLFYDCCSNVSEVRDLIWSFPNSPPFLPDRWKTTCPLQLLHDSGAQGDPQREEGPGQGVQSRW